MKLKSFIGSTYTLRSVPYECQRTINLYPEMDELGTGKEQEVAALMSVPGQVLQHAFPRSPIRGIWQTANNWIYVVAGNGLFNLASTDGVTWNHTLIAELTSNSGPVCMCDGISNMYNGILNSGLVNSVVVVDGTFNGLTFQEGTNNVYQLNPGNNFVGSNFVTFQDGIFIFSQPGSPTAFFCADPRNISGLDEVTVNRGGDVISRVLADHDVLWFFGNKSSSVWQNTGGGGTSATFQEIPGSYAEGGCNAPWTIQKLAGQLFWVAADDRGFGQVFMKLGYIGMRISTHAVELFLQAAGNLANATAWTYQDQGHSFYCLNVAGASTTWAYDLTSKQWSERAFFSGGEFSRDLVENHTLAVIPNVGSIHLCGDYSRGNVYALSNTDYTLNGSPIKRVRTSPHMSSRLRDVFFASFQVDVEGGVGLDGEGYAILAGYGAAYGHTATNTPLVGDGPTFQFQGTDGTFQTPTNTPTITATGAWSENFTVSGGSVTILPGTFPVSSTVFGLGNGVGVNFTLSNLPYNCTLTSATITASDWRGVYTVPLYPSESTNLCIESQDFATGAWGLLAASLDPSGWNTGLTAFDVIRPSGNTVTVGAGSVTNPTHAYDSTYDTVKMAGTSAVCVSPDSSNTILTLTGWGSQINQTGALFVCLSGVTVAGPGSLIAVDYSMDGGTTWVSTGLDSLYVSPLTPVTVPITVANMANFQIRVYTEGTTTNVYDAVFISSSQGSGTGVNAPDGSNTGTNFIEDSTLNNHAILTSYSATSGKPLTISGYYYIADGRRSIDLIATSPIVAFVGSLTTNQLTVVSIPTGSSLAIGNEISGIGIPPGTTITAGTSSPYTLSFTTPNPIASESMAAWTVLALGNFTASGTATSEVGTASISNVGTLFLGSIVGNTLTVGTIYSGTLGIGMGISGAGIPSGLTITAGSKLSWTVSATLTSAVNDVVMSVGSGAVATGIYRAVVVASEGATGTNQAGFRINDPTSDYKYWYAGNGNSRVGIWGFQIEEASAVTPYKLTEGLISSDYVTVNLATGTAVFNMAPLESATLSWSGSISGISPGPVEFMASFTYQEGDPEYTYVGANPTCSLSYSNDGGKTWTPDLSTPIGSIGQFGTRAIWRRCGKSRNRVWRVSCSDPVKFDLIGAEVAAFEADQNAPRGM